MKNKIFGLFNKKSYEMAPNPPPPISEAILNDDDNERFQTDLQVVDTKDSGERIQQEAFKEIQNAAEQSVKRLHVLQRGRCPQCGETLLQHLFVSVCDSCGWNSYSMPKLGGVKIHTKSGEIINGEKCYVVKDGAALVIRKDAVIARIPESSLEWIEYDWGQNELDDRRKQIIKRMSLTCGWCGKETSPETDGFHMVQVAFGSTQERYCFCCDECFEAFRQMYPSRVHRNCYEHSCENCDLCVKRYLDENDGLRTLAKDFVKVKK